MQTYGDWWTWMSFDPESKVVPAFVAGKICQDNADLLLQRTKAVNGPRCERRDRGTDPTPLHRLAVARRPALPPGPRRSRLATPGAQCLGTHVFEYALIPHSGGWENAYAQAHAFNAPLRAVAPPSSGGPLPLELSFVRSSPPGFVLTAIKRAEEGDGLIVRGFNSTDATCEVTLEADLLWSKVTEVALDESLLRNLGKEGDSVRFVARPKQIVTLRFAL